MSTLWYFLYVCIKYHFWKEKNPHFPAVGNLLKWSNLKFYIAWIFTSSISRLQHVTDSGLTGQEKTRMISHDVGCLTVYCSYSEQSASHPVFREFSWSILTWRVSFFPAEHTPSLVYINNTKQKSLQVKKN